MSLDRQAHEPAAKWLWLIIGAYIVCAALAAWFMPLSRDDGRRPRNVLEKYIPPDEEAHIEYIEYLLNERRLPVFSDPDASYEAHQPPLFYISCIPALLLGSAVGDLLNLPDHRAAITLALRAWCVLIGALVIWAVYALALRLFSGDGKKALLAAGCAALLPMHFVNLAGVTNDGLSELLVTVCLLWALKAAVSPERRVAVVLGLLIGVAMLVKSNSLFMLGVAIVAVVLGTQEEKDRSYRLRQMGQSLGLMLCATLLVCGWWLVRNQMLYGDPLAQKVFVELFSHDRATPQWFLERGFAPVVYLQLVLLGTILSFWGVFGQAIIFMPIWFYQMGLALTVAVLVGLGKSWWRWRTSREDHPMAAAWLLCGVALLLVGLMYLRFNMTFYQAQARYLFTAIGPLAALFAAGWWSLWQSGDAGEDRSSISKIGWTLWWVVLGLLAVVALWYLRPGAPMLGSPLFGI